MEHGQAFIVVYTIGNKDNVAEKWLLDDVSHHAGQEAESGHDGRDTIDSGCYVHLSLSAHFLISTYLLLAFTMTLCC